MSATVNRVRQAYDEGRPSFGAYVGTPSPRIVEWLGFAGLDFVRIDMHGAGMSIETVQDMILAAHAVGITPFVRVPLDAAYSRWTIGAVLQMGALGIIVPRVSSRVDAETAVRAAKVPPEGERWASSAGFPAGYGQMSNQEHLDWARRNIIVTAQVETKSGVEAIDEIASVPGLDMVQSGRGGLSYEYGVPGQSSHPNVLEAEKRIIEAGLKHGKMVSVQHHVLSNPQEIERLRVWIRQGVHCLSLGQDRDIVAVYRRLLVELRSP